MKKLVLGFTLLFALLGCGSKKEEKVSDTSKEHVYIVGTNAEYPPFEYLENGKISGFDPDLIEEAFKRLGLKMEWANISFDGLIPALQTKKIDVIIAGMSITPERAKAVNFSNPYLISKVAFVENKKHPVGGMEGLVGKTFGAELGTTKEASARKIKDAKVVPFAGNTPALIALKASKIDAIVVDESVAISYLSSNPDLNLVGYQEGEPKAIAVGKHDPELLKKLDIVLDEMLKDGTVDELKKKYGV